MLTGYCIIVRTEKYSPYISYDNLPSSTAPQYNTSCTEEMIFREMFVVVVVCCVVFCFVFYRQEVLHFSS